jgi:hypothetical protein
MRACGARSLGLAVDTRDKRASLIGLAKPWVRLLQTPTGTIGQGGRQMLEMLYAGIAAAGPTIVTWMNGLTTSVRLTGVGQ